MTARNTRILARFLFVLLGLAAGAKAFAIDLLWSDKYEMGALTQFCWTSNPLYPTAASIPTTNNCHCQDSIQLDLLTTATVTNIPAGNYNLFVRCYAYPSVNNGNQTITAIAGGDPVSLTVSTEGNVWKKVGLLNVPVDTTSMSLVFQRVPTVRACGTGPEIARTAPYPLDVFAVYMTTETNVVITGLPELVQVWNYPTTTNTSPPVARNLLSNGGFEMPLPAGTWSSGHNSTRYWSIDESITTAEFFEGKSSMAVYFDMCHTNGVSQIIQSKPVRVAANKAHTFSVYAKSTKANSTVRLALINPNAYPAGSGFPAMPVYDSGTQTITTNWARYQLANQILLEYPYAEYYPQITVASTSGGTVWLDAVALEEGPTPTTYTPRDPFEVGGQIGHKAALIYDDESPDVRLIFRNGTGSGSSDTVRWRLYHKGFSQFATGTVGIVSVANSYSTNLLSFPTLKYGFYRLEVELQGKEHINTETDFIYMRRPRDEPYNNFLIGMHTTHWHFMQQKLKRAGFHHYRSLSPGGWFRMSNAQPGDGVYTYYDTEVDMIHQYGVENMGVLYQETPFWAQRHFITMQEQVGTFQLGETVNSGTGTGIVTWIATTNDFVPTPSMQLRNASGAFTIGATITGATSGATAKLSAKMHVQPNGSSPNLNCVWTGTTAVDKWRPFCSNLVAHYTSVEKWEALNEPGGNGNAPQFNSDGRMTWAALFARESVLGIRDASATDKIIINAGHQMDSFTDVHWNLLPTSIRTNIWGQSFHLYPTTLDGRGVVAKAWCVARGLAYLNDETGYEDSSSHLTYGNNRKYGGVAVDKFQASETDTRKLMATPRMICTNIIETAWPGVERYYYYQMHDRSNAGDELGTLGSHYTTMNIHGTFKAKTSPILFQNYILRQPLGMILTNAQYKVFANVGPTNSQWLAVYTSHPTNMVMSWSLTSSNYECYDLDGNLMTFTSQQVPFSRYPTFVRGINVSMATLTNAVVAATFDKVPDTTPPEVIITRCPTGIVTAQENASGISVSWAGFDDVALPWTSDPVAIQYRYKVDSGAFSGWSGLCQVPPQSFAVGTHTFYVEARDQAGRVGAAQKTFTIQ